MKSVSGHCKEPVSLVPKNARSEFVALSNMPCSSSSVPFSSTGFSCCWCGGDVVALHGSMWVITPMPPAHLPLRLGTKAEGCPPSGFAWQQSLGLCSSTEGLPLLYFISWVLEKKELKDCVIFFRAGLDLRSCRISTMRFTLLLYQGYRNIISPMRCLTSIERGGKHLLGTVPSIITSIIDFIQPEERKSKYFLHCLWQRSVGNILQYGSVRMALLVQTKGPSGPATCLPQLPQLDT